MTTVLFQVLEFCECGALLNRLRSSEKPMLLATQLLNYALQLASGMSYFQKKGYVHRDLGKVTTVPMFWKLRQYFFSAKRN